LLHSFPCVTHYNKPLQQLYICLLELLTVHAIQGIANVFFAKFFFLIFFLFFILVHIVLLQLILVNRFVSVLHWVL